MLRRFDDEDGSVLIAVVGIMVVLTVLAFGAASMADDNLFQSKQQRSRAQALSVAEAGLDQALWRLKTSGMPTSTLVLSLPTGSCEVTTIPLTMYTKRIISRGSSISSPTASRVISTEVFTMSIWDMIFCDGPAKSGGNGHINGNATFHGMWYMRGDWPDNTGNAKFEGGPFFVKDGNVALGGSATIGEAGKVDLYCNGTVNWLGVNARLHTEVPDIPAPEQGAGELWAARNTALAESGDNLQGNDSTLINDETRVSGETTGLPTPRSGYYKVVDNDSVINKSVAAVHIGYGNGSFGKPFDPAIGHSPDDFAYDAATDVLTVQGTVFVDAQDLYIDGAKFAGKGTIICSGDIHIEREWEPYDTDANDGSDPGCADFEDFPTINNVGISGTGAVTENVNDCWGCFYSATSFAMTYNNNGRFHGTIVAPDVTFGMHSDVWVIPMSTSLPPSMPAYGGQMVVASGWHEGDGVPGR